MADRSPATRRGLAAVLVAVFAFLYIPIATLVALSFNEGGLPTAWTGFSVKWYGALMANRDILSAALNTLIVAVISTAIAAVLGTQAAAAAVHPQPGCAIGHPQIDRFERQFAKQAGPDLHGRVAAGDSSRAVVVVAHPGHRYAVTSISDKPAVAAVIGRAGLAGNDHRAAQQGRQA